LFCDRLLTRTLRARWLRGRKAPRSGQCGLWCRPLGFTAADVWKVVSPIHMGIMHSRYEGLVAPSLSANWDKVLVGEGLTSRVADPTLFGLIGINPPPSAVGLPAGRVADPTLFGLTGINPPPSAVGLPAGRVAPSSLCSPRQFSFIGAFRVGVGPNAQEAELIGKLQDSGIMLARSGREQRLDCRTIISRFQIL
jgi:hypothetical protein